MAIAFDAASGRSFASSTSLTFAHTCTGSNRILFVSCSVAGSNTVSGVTYNGVAMTSIGSILGSNNVRSYLWYLFAPATGSNNIVISASASTSIWGAGASYTGAQQGNVPDASSTSTNSASTSIAASVTTTRDNAWVVAGGICGGGGMSDGSGTTSRQSGTGDQFIADSNSAVTPVGSNTLTINCSSGVNNMVIASFAPPVSVTVTPTVLSAVFSLVQPTVTLGMKFTATVLSATFNLIQPIVKRLTNWSNITKSTGSWDNQDKSQL